MHIEPLQQLNDNPELLELMIKDMNSTNELYKPTNLWANYERIFLKEIRTMGLHDFRRRKNSVLYSFGATDLLPNAQALTHLSIWPQMPISTRIARFVLGVKKFERLFKHISYVYSGINHTNLRLLFFEFAKCYGERNQAKPVSSLESSTVGNPEDVFSIDGKMYTLSLLYYYVMYAYCNKFVNFDTINSIMELGSGSGKQIEVIKKLHPNICFYVFDIPPQLYVCQQYLSALFPDSVVPYEETRTMTTIPEDREGKIFIFGTWKLPELTNLSYDLFWNSASLQEMEPDVVLNYLGFVNQQAKYAFLFETMTGTIVASSPGSHGVLERTTLEHYKKGLKNFELRDLSRAVTIPNLKTNKSFAFWIRNDLKMFDREGSDSVVSKDIYSPQVPL